jgi:transcription elongation factor Elf1
MVMGPFDCPSCGSELYFSLDSKMNRARTKCPQCGFSGEYEIVKSFQPVDYYNKLVDDFRGSQSGTA